MKKSGLCALLFLSFVLCGASYADEPLLLKDVEVISYNSTRDYSVVQGELTNNSKESYKSASFILSFYDENNKLIGVSDVFTVRNFGIGEAVAFKQIIEKNITKWETCKIRLDSSY
ncbi:MAG: FxLYD domain-containing protein [Synergistaceae bacterium]|jgi:hypothetical protein|nr:FxLYD domain-containing protein [Synergistaceae bacterium]